jgi:hypothetical protein
MEKIKNFEETMQSTPDKKAVALLKLFALGEQEIENGDFVEQSKVFEKIEKENPWLKK